MSFIQDSVEAGKQLSIDSKEILSFKLRYYDNFDNQQGSISIPGGIDFDVYEKFKKEYVNKFKIKNLDIYPWEIKINDATILVYTHEDGPTIHGDKLNATEIVSVAEAFRKWLEKWLRNALNKPSLFVRLDVN